MRISILLSVFIGIYSSYAQIGIGTTTVDNSALLEVPSNTQGLLIPRVTSIEQNTLALPAHSLLVYNTDSNTYNYNRGTTVLPDWAVILPNTTATSYLGQSAKYANTNSTSNINTVSETNIPIFGEEIWNDNSSLYVVSGTTIQVTETGRYEITTNISISKESNSARKAPEMYLLVNGIRVGSYSSTGYIRRTNGHEASSLHLNEVVELTANDIVSVGIIESANTGTANMRSTASSNFYIEKKN